MNITNANTNNENANKGAANHPSNAKEALVQKLQGVLQELRQERDQLHRSKELALERCRLVREEEQSLSKIVASLKEKKEKLQKAALEIKAGLGPVEASVQETTKQVRVVHVGCSDVWYPTLSL